jgi:hypothetical protein
MKKLCLKCAEVARRNNETARMWGPGCAILGFVPWDCDNPECGYHPSNK